MVFLQVASNTKRFKFDAFVSMINGLFPKIDNLEYFPTELLLPIFVSVDDVGLLNLFNISYRFEGIAKMAFKQKYANKYFVIDSELDSQREFYMELFSRFGGGIKAIEASGIQKINKSHWMTQMLHQYTSQIEKFSFERCTFEQLNDILSQHITDLTLRNCDDTNGAILPSYRNLKKLRLEFDYSNDYVEPEILAQTYRSNPALESLTLLLPEDDDDDDSGNAIHNHLLVVAEHLKHLKELEFNYGYETFDWRFSDEALDLIVDSLKHLESLRIFTTTEYDELMRRLGLKCGKNMKKLVLGGGDPFPNGMSDANIKAIGLFAAVEILELPYDTKSDTIESIVEQLPKLRHLKLPMYGPPLNASIISWLLKCQTIKTITIDLSSKHSMGPINVQFFNEFVETMQNPNGKIVFTHEKETLGVITKEEIVWQNKRLHWIGYDFRNNSSDLNLLDLANKTGEEQQNPFDLMLRYLDLGSLYSLSRASKRSNQLVGSFVARHSHEQGIFTITDEFSNNVNGLATFGEHIINLRLNVTDTDFIGHLHTLEDHYKNLNKLWIGSFSFGWAYRWAKRLSKLFTEFGTFFPQVRHLVIADAGSEYYCDFCEISRLYPKLETFETKTPLLHDCCGEYCYYWRDCCGDRCGENLRNLKKFIFKSSDACDLNRLFRIFNNTYTELISIM